VSTCKAGTPYCKNLMRSSRRVLEYKKQYYKANKERILESRRIFYRKNKKSIYSRTRKWSLSNPSKAKKYYKKWYKNNKEKAREKSRAWLKVPSNLEKSRIYNLKYRKRNKQRVKKWIIKAHLKISNNPFERIKHSLRSRVYSYVKSRRFIKSKRTEKLLGCNWIEIRNHLESQFKEGMCWENYGKGGWHIDHKYPLSKAKDIIELEELFKYKNLQPLWEADNWSKHNRIIE
jgi:hypothetical protein